MAENYLLTNHRREILEILSHEDTNKCFAINISFEKLCIFDVILGSTVIKEPETVLEDLNKSVLKIQRDLLNELDAKFEVKYKVNCRIHSIHLQKFWRTLISNEDVGLFLLVKGTVVRMSATKLLEFQRQYICTKCKYNVTVKADYTKRYMIKQPKHCTNPEGCNGTNLVTFGELDSDNCKDYQEIKIQEDVSSLSKSLMPNTMWVTLEDDLVDSCKPGDSVSICGIIKRRWSEFCKGSKIDIDLCLKANHIEVTNRQSTAKITPEIREMFDDFWQTHREERLSARDLILKSFCPELYGLYLVKLAVAVVLAGGSQHDDQNNTGVRTRSESHLLLVGDPGTGKSQLLRFASKIIPRSVLTTGVGSTSAGLTVTAIMEGREWQLEAGALVLSDGGICCIDEFNSIKQHDRDSIHEAMEQQTISIAKAGIVCKLNSRCSILAACNPKGNLNLLVPLSMSVALPSPLLSRFDLILLIKDTVRDDWDTMLADYILNGCKSHSKLTERAYWDVETLQAYFAIIRKMNPKLTKEANDILSAYYQTQRRLECRNKARTTVRLLDSLVRLSQGHARLMYHERVEVCDSIYALILVDSAMEYDCSVLNLNIGTHEVFPESPLGEYRRLVQIILEKLGLEDILEKELDKVSNSGVNTVFRSRFFRENSKEIEVETNRLNVSQNCDMPDNSNKSCNINVGELKNSDTNIVEKLSKSDSKGNEEQHVNIKNVSLITSKYKNDERHFFGNINDEDLEIDVNTNRDLFLQKSSGKNADINSGEENKRKNYSKENEEHENIKNVSLTTSKNKNDGFSKRQFFGNINDLDLEIDINTNQNSSLKKSPKQNNIDINSGEENKRKNEISDNDRVDQLKKFKFSKKSITVNLSETTYSSARNERTIKENATLEDDTINESTEEKNREDKNKDKANVSCEPKASVKDKLSKFRFVPKDDKAQKNNEGDVSKSAEKEPAENKKCKQNNDLKILNMIPSLNDMRNIEIDFDCNFERNLTQHTKSSSSSNSGKIQSVFESSGYSIDDLDLEL